MIKIKQGRQTEHLSVVFFVGMAEMQPKVTSYPSGTIRMLACCRECVWTFWQESCSFEDILGLRSRTFVTILEQELRIDNSRLRMRIDDCGLWMRIEEVLRIED